MQKQDEEKMPNVHQEDWNTKQLHKEGANEQSDETLRRVLRADEQKGNPDKRDVVGNVDSNETPQGREEAKNDKGNKANTNG